MTVTRFDHAFPAVEQALSEARSFETLEAALQQVVGLPPKLMAADVRGHKLFLPRLDLAVADLPRRLGLPPVQVRRCPDEVCILVTRFHPTGGHRTIAADIARQLGAERVTFVFTNIYDGLRHRFQIGQDPAASSHPSRAILLLSAPSLVEKIIELHHLLAALRPGRIFLMNHHMDAVAVAAAWPYRDIVDYLHHTDMMPALGASLAFGGHADLTYTCHLACREAGLPTVYAGMTGPEAAVSAARAPGERLRLATCGSLQKYRHPARFRWTDYAVAALRATDGEIVHIGPFDDSFAAEVAGALSGAGLPADRYRFVGAAADLQQALAEHGAQVFVSSYPEAGGKANLEAMMAGLPVVTPVEPDLGVLIADRWPLPQAVNVSTPTELAAVLSDADRLIAAARDPQNTQLAADQRRRFFDYVAGRPVAPIRPQDRLPS